MKVMNFESLMTVFAHQDDETFSAGGTVAKFSANGKKSWCVTVTSDINRKEEFDKACKILGSTPVVLDNDKITGVNEEVIILQLIELIRTYRPEIIITHVPFDYHREHRRVHQCVMEAIEWASHTTGTEIAHQVQRVYGAETTVLIPFPEIYIDISSTNHLRMEAIACYESQSHKGGKGFYSQFHGTRTHLRGIQAGVAHAEAFIEFPIAKSGSFKPTKHFDWFR